MAKTKTSKKKAPAPPIKKDGKGRFWIVPKDGGAEQGPFATKQEAQGAKAGAPKTATKSKKAQAPKEKKLSAIDAAAQVLAGSKAPMNAKEMIEAMAAKGLWISPGGKTPHATLYSAIIREIALKSKEARFVKTERGKFAVRG